MTAFLNREQAEEFASSVTVLTASLDPPAEHPLVQRFVPYWEDKRRGRLAPARQDIDPLDFPDFLPCVVLWDVEEGGEDFRVRLVGEQIIETFGFNATGMTIRDERFVPDKELQQEFLNFHKLSTLWPHPIFYSGNLWYWRDKAHIPVSCLPLPLSDDGKTITKILNVWHFGE